MGKYRRSEIRPSGGYVETRWFRRRKYPTESGFMGIFGDVSIFQPSVHNKGFGTLPNGGYLFFDGFQQCDRKNSPYIQRLASADSFGVNGDGLASRKIPWRRQFIYHGDGRQQILYERRTLPVVFEREPRSRKESRYVIQSFWVGEHSNKTGKQPSLYSSLPLALRACANNAVEVCLFNQEIGSFGGSGHFRGIRSVFSRAGDTNSSQITDSNGTESLQRDNSSNGGSDDQRPVRPCGRSKRGIPIKAIVIQIGVGIASLLTGGRLAYLGGRRGSKYGRWTWTYLSGVLMFVGMGCFLALRGWLQ